MAMREIGYERGLRHAGRRIVRSARGASRSISPSVAPDHGRPRRSSGKCSALFVQQALTVRDEIADADLKERLFLAHALKGSARGVGAFAIADCAGAIEDSPTIRLIVKRLASLIDEVRDFIAAISR